MSIRIESGVGDGNRLAVFDNRMRELATEQSTTNHISTQILNGKTGVFTVRARGPTTGTSSLSNGQKLIILSISNNDFSNILIIESIYIQLIASSIATPDPNFIISVDNQLSVGALSILNDNKFSTITPIITAKPAQSGVSSTISASNIIRIYPTIGDIYNIVIQGSDTIILPGKTTTTDLGRDNNTISISLFNGTGASVTGIVTNAFIRFMMVPPDSLG